MISGSGIGEIHPADCQMTAVDVVVVTTNVAAIAMIGNNAVWIHRLIKHCLQSWTDKFGSRLRNDRPRTTRLRKHVNNFRCDLFRDAGKTMRSGAMSTVRITSNQNFENIVMDSCANFRECPFVGFHTRSRKPRRSGIHSNKFSKWRMPGTMRTLTRFTNPN